MAMAADYAVRLCEGCGKRLDVFRPDSIKACSRGCQKRRKVTREGRKGGRATKWRELYERARSANGQWVQQQCGSKVEANRLVASLNQRRDFEASQNGAIVSVRLVAA